MFDDDIVKKLDQSADWMEAQISIFKKDGSIKNPVQLEDFIIKFYDIKKYLNRIIDDDINKDYSDYCKYLIGCMNRFEIFTKNANIKNVRITKLRKIEKQRKINELKKFNNNSSW